MKPVNNKSLLHFIYEQMEKLDTKQITVAEANAQANLMTSAHKLMDYELKRAKIQMELAGHNAVYKDGLRIREIEGKNFEET